MFEVCYNETLFSTQIKQTSLIKKLSWVKKCEIKPFENLVLPEKKDHKALQLSFDTENFVLEQNF